jgi:dipeptidyl aminopeptidase/acylaminoacyl peptidase
VRVHDLEAGTSAEYAATDRYHVYGLAFDLAETRLAFLELAPPEVENMPWAIVVVRLEDGMTTRLEASTLPELHRYPGNPLGWSASGDELLIATFLPYSDGLYAGVWAISVPPDTPSGMLTGLPSRLLVPGGGYRSVPRISPDGTRLLYLARDPEYMPADFEPVEDFAANQLWVLDLASGQPALLYEVTDGDALMRDAAWSPDGSEILLAQGHFAGPEFGTLALKILDAEGQPRDAPAVPVAEGKYAMSLHWCRPDLALVQYMTRDTMFELAGVDPTGTGDWWEPQSGQPAFLLGCLD